MKTFKEFLNEKLNKKEQLVFDVTTSMVKDGKGYDEIADALYYDHGVNIFHNEKLTSIFKDILKQAKK